jgi:hypothetical protein
VKGKHKLIIFLSTLVGTALLAAGGAIPYGYFVQALWMAAGDELIGTLCWALYIFVAVLLWLMVWRIVYLAVLHRPGRRL